MPSKKPQSTLVTRPFTHAHTHSDTNGSSATAHCHQRISTSSDVGFSLLPKDTLRHGQPEREPNQQSFSQRSAALLLLYLYPVVMQFLSTASSCSYLIFGEGIIKTSIFSAVLTTVVVVLPNVYCSKYTHQQVGQYLS